MTTEVYDQRDILVPDSAKPHSPSADALMMKDNIANSKAGLLFSLQRAEAKVMRLEEENTRLRGILNHHGIGF